MKHSIHFTVINRGVVRVTADSEEEARHILRQTPWFKLNDIANFHDVEITDVESWEEITSWEDINSK
jgi:hypothetical protein